TWLTSMGTTDDPPLGWTDDRDVAVQGRRESQSHVGEAWNAFSGRRDETLALLTGLTPPQWGRPGHHERRGRVTLEQIVGYLTWHDDNHLDQMARALDGRV